MRDLLYDLLSHFGIVAPADRQLFTESAKVVTLQKHTDIFTEGKKNSNEYLLVSGVAHRYNISEKGDAITTGFYLSPSVITPHFARTKGGKSLFSLQALTEVVLAEIPVATLDHLRSTHEAFYVFGQRVVEKELSLSLQWEVAFRSAGARERLLALRQWYPNLENKVPHHTIASFLGITPVSFSRLRNELAAG